MPLKTKFVSAQLGVDKAEVTLASSFANDLNADSLDTVELVMELEDSFSTSIPDDKAEQIQTVGNAVDFIVDSTAESSLDCHDDSTAQ